MSIFNDLVTSLEQAIEIEHGLAKPSRVTKFQVADVRGIREKLQVSQAEFARGLGTSVHTIKSWETKRRNPTGMAAKVLAAIQEDPEVFEQIAAH